MSNKPTAEERAETAHAQHIEFDYGLFGHISPATKSAMSGYATCIREEVEPLESEVSKLRALVRGLVDRASDVIARWDSPKWKWDQHTGDLIHELRKEVDAAKSQVFTPTNTSEG